MPSIEKDVRPRIRIGRLTLWLWSGSWSWWFDTEDCDHCRNLYLGPFGVEWTRDLPRAGGES